MSEGLKPRRRAYIDHLRIALAQNKPIHSPDAHVAMRQDEWTLGPQMYLTILYGDLDRTTILRAELIEQGRSTLLDDDDLAVLRASGILNDQVETR